MFDNAWCLLAGTMARVCLEVVARSSKKILAAKEAEVLAFVLPK